MICSRGFQSSLRSFGSRLVLGGVLIAGTQVLASPRFESTSRWLAQGRWASSSSGVSVDALFWMDLSVSNPNERGTSEVRGFLGTPWGTVPVLVGYYISDARRLSLVYEQNAQTKVYIRGYLSADSRLYGAQVFATLSSTPERASEDAQTQALRKEWDVPAEIGNDQIFRPLGSVSAWAR